MYFIDTDLISNNLDYLELDDKLIELFSTEYALGEMKMRAHKNSRLIEYNTLTSQRFKYWQNLLQNHAKKLAATTSQEVLETLTSWLNSHSESDFANTIISQIEEIKETVDDQGNISWGRNQDLGEFTFNIMEPTIDIFLHQTPYFVEEFIGEELINLEQDEPSGPEDPSFEYYQKRLNYLQTMTEQDKINYVKEIISDSGYDWNGLETLLGQYGDFTKAVKLAIQQHMMPAWRQFWGDGVMDRAEKDVSDAKIRLEKAMQSQNLNELLVAINLALHAEHVHGTMSEHAGISDSTLYTLSNLDTDVIDEFIDGITGKNWKQANRNLTWLQKVAII